MSPVAQGGLLDLTQTDFANDPIHLDGEWDYYWNQLLPPENFTANLPSADGMFPVPTSWSNLSMNGQRLSTDGYVTMHLRVLVPPNIKTFGLFVPSFNTAYRVWVNGQEVATSGLVSTDPAIAQPAGFGRVGRFTTDSDTLDIVVQASSFEGVPGGPIGRFALGPLEVVEARDNRQIATDLFVVGACAILGLVYFVLFLLRRKETAFLWFGLFCLIIALRATLVGREVIHLLWPSLGWELSLKLIFIGGPLSAVAFASFATALYPQQSWPRVILPAWGVALLACLGIIISPPSALFSPVGLLFNGVVVAAILYSAVVVIRAVRHHRPGAILLLLSTVPLGLAIAIEALGSARLIPIYSLASFGVLGTIVAQTFTLLRNFTLAFAGVEALSERLDRTNKAYYRFVPRELLRLMGKDDIVAVELGDQAQRTMTILFTDIRGFTSLSEKLSPEENFTFINLLLSRLSPIIREHHGFIDKYLGDGIMALFPNRADDAVQAAIAIRHALADFNAERSRRSEPNIRLGLGLHTGSLMLGTVGEPERMDGTVIADAVNTASRLESLTKLFQVTAIASAQTIKAVENWSALGVRTLGKIRAKGKQDAIALYELFDGDPADLARLKRATLADFEQAVSRYETGHFPEAAVLFQTVLTANPADPTAAYYAARCAYFQTHGTPPGWDGIETATEK